MRVLIDSLKRLYTAGRLTKEQIAARVEKGTIDEAEYEEITVRGNHRREVQGRNQGKITSNVPTHMGAGTAIST